MAVNEMIILIFSVMHILLYKSGKQLTTRLLIFEGSAITLLGLFSLAVTGDPFFVLTGSWNYPIQPTDLIFIGLGVVFSAILIKFIIGFANLQKNESLLAILPWTITGQYRYFHELLWNFQYWITTNVLEGKFSDLIPGIGTGQIFYPGLLTHMNALLFTIFFIFNLSVLIHVFKKK